MVVEAVVMIIWLMRWWREEGGGKEKTEEEKREQFNRESVCFDQTSITFNEVNARPVRSDKGDV
jgi:hypothetical protein